MTSKDQHDFEVLYRNTPEHIRSNANLPGQFVFPVSSLEMEADGADEFRALLEAEYPGYGDKWHWKDFGIPENYNPLKVFITPYLQISRADGMKGSEQVVRGFQGFQPNEFEGIGQPSLMPKAGAGPTVVIQNGVRELKEKRGLRGLGGR